MRGGDQDADVYRRKTQGEDDHPQEEERGGEQIPLSRPSEGTDPAETLISDLEPPAR